MTDHHASASGFCLTNPPVSRPEGLLSGCAYRPSVRQISRILRTVPRPGGCEPQSENHHPPGRRESAVEKYRVLPGFTNSANFVQWARRICHRCELCVAQRKSVWSSRRAPGPSGFPASSCLNRLPKSPVFARLLKKAQVQGVARSEARGVLSTYVAAPRERGNAADGPFSAAC